MKVVGFKWKCPQRWNTAMLIKCGLRRTEKGRDRNGIDPDGGKNIQGLSGLLHPWNNALPACSTDKRFLIKTFVGWQARQP